MKPNERTTIQMARNKTPEQMAAEGASQGDFQSASSASSPASVTNSIPASDMSPTAEIQIQGLTFEYSTPYVAGSVMTEGEAHQLNGVRGENLRNNFAGNIKDAKEEAVKARGEGAELTEGEIETLKTAFASYQSDYVFSGKRQSRTPSDPVKAKATKMARETIEAALRAKNIKPSELKEGKMDELIATYLAAHPEVTEEARAQIAKVKESATAALDGLDLSDATKPQTPAAAA